ncbi:hypothetical protein [Flammeovirga sp. OC4]|uniref:hypothetical protein n=1 Tax=Flammeovirga sp. OC4 TaxID=1382345 RepID=UPI0005C494F9|nr:hypothetical protein [Flammeovirga sp. OC4]
MKKLLSLLQLILISNFLLAQSPTSLTFQAIDSPDGSKYNKVTELVFKKNKKGNYEAYDYTIKGEKEERLKLEEGLIISQSLVERMLLTKRTKEYYWTDLEKGNQQWDKELMTREITTHHPILIDSIKFCNKWDALSLKGEWIGSQSIIIKADTTVIFEYGYGDRKNRTFDLEGYLLTYPLFNEQLSCIISTERFGFTFTSLISILEYYNKTLECEEYYYAEFMKENPKRTRAENRMRIGWDFHQYLSQREKK